MDEKLNEYVREEYDIIAPGAIVTDPEGREVGTVGETIGDYVELRGGDQVSSVWISRADFGEARHEAVLLGFPSDEISARSVASPPQTLDEAAETGVLHDDAASNRESMLEELAEQRAEMHEEGRATEAADRTLGQPVEEELEERGVR